MNNFNLTLTRSKKLIKEENKNKCCFADYYHLMGLLFFNNNNL